MEFLILSDSVHLASHHDNKKRRHLTRINSYIYRENGVRPVMNEKILQSKSRYKYTRVIDGFNKYSSGLKIKASTNRATNGW
jgi:hypothetical protein